MLDFFVKSALFVALLALAAGFAPMAAPWQVMVIVLALAVPGFLAGAYDATIRRIVFLQVFDGPGWIRRRLSVPWLRLLLWGVWALLNAFVLLAQFQRLDGLAWVLLVATIPAFWVVFQTAGRSVAPQVKPYFRVALKLSLARWITPSFVVVAYAVIQLALHDLPAFETFGGALDAHPAETANSATMSALGEAVALLNGIEAYALSKAGALGVWSAIAAVLILALTNWVHFYAACLAVSCLLIPRAEYARMFGRLTESTEVLPVVRGRIAFISAVTALFVCIIYVPSFLQLEGVARTEQQAVRATFERIRGPESDWLVAEGTILKFEQLPLTLARGTEEALAELRGAINVGFDRLPANVDKFLEWYYTLPAEYARLAALAGGNIEEFLTTRMQDFLEEGAPFADLDMALAAMDAQTQAYWDEYTRAATAIILENLADTRPGEAFDTVREVSLGELVQSGLDGFTAPIDSAGAATMRTATRVAAAGVIGGVVAKVTGKGLLKVLAKPVAGKLVAGGGGASIGALVGGTLGSVVPIVGTAAGAVVGGVVGGIAAGLAIEAGLVRIDEYFTRDEMRADILAAIEEARAEMLAMLPPEDGQPR